MNGYSAYQNSGGYSSPGLVEPTLQTSGGRQKLCFAPSELFGQGPAQGFGYFAEAFILFNLIPQFHAQGIAPVDMYTDYAFAGSVDPPMIAFLKQKNPAKSSLIQSVFTATPHKRPDILVHTAGLQEFYEIKPDSVTGRLAGAAKIANITAYMAGYGLPYTPGKTFKPPSKMDVGHFYLPIPGRPPMRIDISIGLRFSGGGIYYSICIEADWELLLLLGLTGALILAIFKFFKDMFSKIGEIAREIGDWIYDHPIETAFLAFAALIIIIALLEPTPFGEAVAAVLVAAEAELYLLIASAIGFTPVAIPVLQTVPVR